MEYSTHGNAGSNRHTPPSPRLQRSRSGAPSLAYEYQRSCSTSSSSTSSKPSHSKPCDESNKPSKQDSSKKFSVFQSFKKNVPVHEKKERSAMTHYHLQIPHPAGSSQPTRKARSAATSPSAWALSPGRSMPINPLKQLQEVGGRTSSHDHDHDRKQGEKPVMKKTKGNGVGGMLQRLFRPMKVSAAETEALHHLRMLHTRHMQWRFVNVRSARAMVSREMSAQVQEAKFDIWDCDTCTQTNCIWWALETSVLGLH